MFLCTLLNKNEGKRYFLKKITSENKFKMYFVEITQLNVRVGGVSVNEKARLVSTLHCFGFLTGSTFSMQ